MTHQLTRALAVCLLSLLCLPVLSANAAARSGPPLLCFPMELPADTKLPFDVDSDQPLSATLAETAHVLAESDVPEVHMEILRRAVLVLQGDTAGLDELLKALRWQVSRAAKAEANLARDGLQRTALTRALALPHFDLAYALAACAEAGHHASDLDTSMSVAKRALGMRPGDGALSLGASLVALSVRDERASWTWLADALKQSDGHGRLARNVSASMGRIHGGLDLAELSAHVRGRLDGI